VPPSGHVQECARARACAGQRARAAAAAGGAAGAGGAEGGAAGGRHPSGAATRGDRWPAAAGNTRARAPASACARSPARTGEWMMGMCTNLWPRTGDLLRPNSSCVA